MLNGALLYLRMSCNDLRPERVQTKNRRAAELSVHNGETSSQISAGQQGFILTNSVADLPNRVHLQSDLISLNLI